MVTEMRTQECKEKPDAKVSARTETLHKTHPIHSLIFSD